MATETKGNNGLVCAYLLDGEGNARGIGWSEIHSWNPGDGILWVHLDYTLETARQWLERDSGLDEVIVHSLLADESRPRCAGIRDGLLINLRGVNMNPGADPEDMVPIRLWIENQRIVSAQRRHLLSVTDLRQLLDTGRAPNTTGQFLVELVDLMSDRMAVVIGDIDESVDNLKDQLLTLESHELRQQIANIRREAISLRRYLAPLREAMNRMYNERAPWLQEMDKLHLREIGDRITRYVEDLDAARERAAVVQEELMSRLAEQMNQRMYLLSMIAALFLPLGFLTGLLGINVGGIPGSEYKGAFMIFVILLVVLVMLQFIWFKQRKWF